VSPFASWRSPIIFCTSIWLARLARPSAAMRSFVALLSGLWVLASVDSVVVLPVIGLVPLVTTLAAGVLGLDLGQLVLRGHRGLECLRGQALDLVGRGGVDLGQVVGDVIRRQHAILAQPVHGATALSLVGNWRT
jgi:hypothetical protein